MKIELSDEEVELIREALYRKVWGLTTTLGLAKDDPQVMAYLALRERFNRDVHTEHCCAEHGCKYGHDDCPVETGRKSQSHPCEMCEFVRQDEIEALTMLLARAKGEKA